jgi:tetrahydromethanopterin S-methyltransferase subunit G
MSTDVTREEFVDPEARVRVIDREVEGEKLVTRHILEQTRRNGDDLAAIKSRLDRVEEKLDGVDLKGLVRKVDGLDRKVDDLTRNLPSIVGEVMREVLRERDDED